ncbi:hypothetical protein H310_02810 [Aphanomyces invadans]|uniref:Uncharacterized protein n=1 Tax=Aphanomyces invadans TaxID=157072 RepID=A0A024UL55_9STRA|nr:hypothetical protein H310_02810 [Aphanomyces invadans]ETW06592.1 hypothetical protein H310_02810 [Aphanomyces invadans]|eukprot:XP_008864667.1 hypothetical protein H310_02810 [Aphanomyces invadans]
MESEPSASPPSTGPTEVADDGMDADAPHLGSSQAANVDPGHLQHPTAAAVHAIGHRTMVHAQATLPGRAADSGSTAAVAARMEPRDRRAADPATTSRPQPTTDPWAAFTAKRVEAAKTARGHDVNQVGDPHKEALGILWRLLVGATLHLIWAQHNKVQYEDATPLPYLAWTELSFLGWMTSVRRWLRLQDPDCPVRSSVVCVLHNLRVQAAYRFLWAKHPNSLLLAPTSAAASLPTR